MKQLYIVAQNAFTIATAGDVPAWEALRPRFAPFAASRAQAPVLEVEIRSGSQPECDAERIYEPADNEISVISARACSLPDSGLMLEFRHIAERKPRVWMKMPAQLDRAEITVDGAGDGSDPSFLTHALMIAYTLATARTGTLMIHASSVVCGGKAYLFQGRSGTGKSTHASLWVGNVAGAELLNDDNPAIRVADDGTATAYGSPWSGKTPCYRNVSAPVGAFVRIVRDGKNYLSRLDPLRSYASLTASVFFMPFAGEDLIAIRHKTIERLAADTACCEMHCRPDADAAVTCSRALSAT